MEPLWGTEAQQREFGQLWLLWHGGPEVGDRWGAAERLRRLAAQAYAPAQHSLAMAYLEGRGAYPNEALALRYCRPAAEQGYPPAENLLGSFHSGSPAARPGLCPHDPREAARWFQRAARKGNAEAQYHLARRYRDGEGVERNLAEAYLWASLASCCSPIPFRPAEVLRGEAAARLDPQARREAAARIERLREELPRPDSEHALFWKHCAQAAGALP